MARVLIELRWPRAFRRADWFLRRRRRSAFTSARGVVEVVVQALAQAVDAVLHVDCGGQLLVGPGEAELLQLALEHGGLERIGEIGSFVEQGARAEFVSR